MSTEQATTNDAAAASVYAQAYDLAARINAHCEQLRQMVLANLRQRYPDAECRSAPPPNLELAKEAAAFWADWRGTRFVQPVVDALRPWNEAALLRFIEDDGLWDCR